MNRERTELGDIDIDIAPSKRPLFIRKVKQERKENILKEYDTLTKNNLGCTYIATFGTEGTRSTILTACRGYKTEEYPDGIDVDVAQYLASLVPSERGFNWSLKDLIEGNEEKGRKPSKVFLNEVQQYPGLLDIMLGIENLINKRSSHASGIIMFDEDPYEHGCFMETPKGEIITQYDLHDCEAAGLTKLDILVTEIQDKLAQAIKFIQKYEHIDEDLSLREWYNKNLHPDILPIEDEKLWEKIQNVEILDLFQLDSDIGRQGAKKVKPRSIYELSDTNGLIRLMTSEKGQETPLDKYVRFKNNINLWYQEMDKYGLTKEEQETLKPYYLSSYGVPPSQEQMMLYLMDPKICGFTLAESNAARKVVGKKQMNKIPDLKKKVFEQAKSPALGKYIWECGVAYQLGYAFSLIHSMSYSFIGVQSAYIATHWNPIYWNTACLVVNSGSLEEDNPEEDDIDYLEEQTENKKKTEKATDYRKNS